MAQNKGAGVLAVRFSALGDVAMTIPALYSACRENPGRQFVLATRKGLAGVFVNAPANLAVVGVDLKGEYKSAASLWRLVKKLAREYDAGVFVDLHDVLRTKLMRFFARLQGLRVASIDKERSKKKRITRQAGKVMLPLKSSIERYRDAFARAGIAVGDSFGGLYGEGQKAPAAGYASISAPKPEGETWIGIAPFAAHPGKVYPLEQMEAVVGILASRPHVRIFIFGAGPAESAVAQAWAAKYPAVTSLADARHGFPAELALLSNLDAAITMDSGNMHLAAIAGAPTASVWGATHSYCGFAGWRQSEDNMVQLSLPCRPCSVFGDKKCARGDLLCLAGIRPEAIVAKVDQIINKNKQKP